MLTPTHQLLPNRMWRVDIGLWVLILLVAAKAVILSKYRIKPSSSFCSHRNFSTSICIGINNFMDKLSCATNIHLNGTCSDADYENKAEASGHFDPLIQK